MPLIGAPQQVLDTLEFETDTFGAAPPSALRIKDSVYAIAYEGYSSDGFVKTVRIRPDGDIDDSVISSYEFDDVQGRYPCLINISGTMYAVAYTGSGFDGYIKTFVIGDDGLIGYALDSSIFDSSNGLYPYIIHIANNVYAVAYAGSGLDGYIKTLTINSDGTIGSVISTLEFDEVSCAYPRIIHVTSNVYAIAYRGSGSDGYLTTVTIDSDGTVGGAVIDSLEFDNVSCSYPNILHVSGTTYAISYTGSGSDGYVRTVTINNDGTIDDTVIDSIEYDGVSGQYPSFVHIADTVYAVAYKGNGSYGYIRSMKINADGTINQDLVANFIFDSTIANYNTIFHVGGNVYAIAYEGVDGDGFLKTIEITTHSTRTRGNIEDVVDDLIWQSTWTEGEFKSRVYRITDNICAVGGGDGGLYTFAVNEDGTLGDSVIDTYALGIKLCHIAGEVYARLIGGILGGWVYTISIDKDGIITEIESQKFTDNPVSIRDTSITRANGKYFAIAYQGPNEDGFVTTLLIHDNGTIGGPVDTLEFDADYCYEPKIIHCGDTISAIAYRGPDNDGFLKTVAINSDGTIDNAVIDTLEFDTDRCYEPDITHVYGTKYAIAYSGTDMDGFLKTVTINSDGTIDDPVVDTLEYDTSSSSYQEIYRVSGNVFAIGYSSCRIVTVTINNDGSIDDTVIDDMQLYDVDSIWTSFCHIAKDIYVMIYQQLNTWDGFAKTIKINSFPKQSSTHEYCSLPQEAVTITGVMGDKSLPDITVSDIPLGAVITKAFVSLKFRMIENYNASANRLFIDQHVQIRENTPGAWKYAIKLAEDQFSIAGNTREKGLQIDGSIDVSDIVQGNGTYEFRLGSAQSAVAGLELNDVEIGLRIQSGT